MKKDIRHWMSRLVHRKYTDLADPRTAGKFSARIEHDGTGCYFPLGSHDARRAAARAVEIDRWVKSKGWNNAFQRYVREFTLAIFWNSNPLLCTYTTLFTRPGQSATVPSRRLSSAIQGIRILIVEANDPVRNALVNWAHKLTGCACIGAFSSSSQAQDCLSRPDVDMVLFNRSLPELDPALTAVGADSPSAAPAIFAFGIYESSDDIFISHTGVSNGYFLRRTPPALVLAPVTDFGTEGAPPPNHFLIQARNYFQNLVAGVHGARPAGEKSLTPREEEILLRLSKGHQDKQIADNLHLSTWTVHNHIKNIFKKLGVHSRTQAAIKHLQK